MSGSQHVQKSFESSDLHRHVAHITPTTAPYGHAKTIAHDRSTRVVPAHQVTSFNSFKHYQEISAEQAVSGAWAGSSVYSEFIIPDTLHVCENVWLRFTLRTVSNAQNDQIFPLPALQMIDTVNYKFEGGNDSQVLHSEIEQLLWLSQTNDEDYRRMARDYGMDPTNKANVYAFPVAGAAAETTDRTYHVRLGGILNSKLFAAGIDDELRVRINWNPTAVTGLTGTPTVSLLNATLVVEETQLSGEDFARMYAQTQSPNGISYKFLEYRYSQHPFNVTNNQQLSIVMNTHSALTSGILAFVRSQQMAGSGASTFFELTNAQLFDSRNLKITPLLTDNFMRSIVHRSCDFPSDSALTVPHYFIPFGVSLASEISHNIHSGALKLDGRDAFHFTASAAMAGVGGNGAVQIELVSLCPAFLTVQRGKMRVEKS